MNNNTVSTGFKQLDKYLKDMKRNALIYICAKPGMGIKTFANNLTDVICKTKENCWIFNFEDEDIEDLFNKFVISEMQKTYAEIANAPYICTIAMPKHEDEPKLSDLQNIGNILQDADVIMFLHRNNFTIHNRGICDPDITELIIAKNNYGDTGTVRLKYNSEIKQFTEVDDY